MILDIPPEVTREFILSKVSEEEIFSFYGVPVVNHVFRSPLRNDKNPTCQFYRSRNNGRLYLRDFAGYFWGDCFDLVTYLFNVHFYEALKIIAKDFKLINGTNEIERKPAIPPVVIQEKEVVNIRVKRREWNQEDVKYWSRFNISKSTLTYFDVAPIQMAWLNGKLTYDYTNIRSDYIAYAYHFEAYNYKLYFPYRVKWRFLHNDGSLLQGYDKLPDTGEALIITKSYKDVMKFYELGIPSIAPMSESQIVSDEILNELKGRFSVVGALYDNDRTGKTSLLKYREKGVIPLMFPIGQPKDLTDYVEKYGEEKTLLLVQLIKNSFL